MIDQLKALRTALEGEGWPVFLEDATGASAWPYVILGVGYRTPGERPVSGALRGVEGDIRVKVVGETADSVHGLAGAIRDVLSPELLPGRVTQSGWVTFTNWVRTEVTEVDRDVKVPGTNLHPIFTVDTYHLTSHVDPNLPD